MFGEDAAKDAADLKAGLSDTTEGLCTAIDWASRLVSVNIGGAVQVMPWAAAPPWVGDRVRVAYWGRKPLCLPVWGSPMGTVASVTGNNATVTGDDGVTYVYPFKSGETPSAGWRVRLDHAGHLCGNRYAGEPGAVAYETPAAPPAAAVTSALFRPTDSGNYRSGSFDSQFVEISVTRSAAYWYGSQIANTIPDTATITRAEIYLTELWDQVPGTATEMALHTQQSRGSEPTYTGTSNVSGSGTVSLLGTYADGLKTGTYYGIGFRKNTGWRRFDTFANSGSIYMEWVN